MVRFHGVLGFCRFCFRLYLHHASVSGPPAPDPSMTCCAGRIYCTRLKRKGTHGHIYIIGVPWRRITSSQREHMHLQSAESRSPGGARIRAESTAYEKASAGIGAPRPINKTGRDSVETRKGFRSLRCPSIRTKVYWISQKQQWGVRSTVVRCHERTRGITAPGSPRLCCPYQ